MRICFIGDSFVNGSGDPECLGWVGRLCASLRKRGLELISYNLGVRRESSADIRRRWRSEVEARLPNGKDGRLVFSFGVNDTLLEGKGLRVPPEDSVANLKSILEEAKAFPILFVGPPPVVDEEQTQRIVELDGRYQEQCRALGIPFLSVVVPLQKSSVWISEAEANDGAHPGASGYAELVQLVQQWPSWNRWVEELSGASA